MKNILIIAAHPDDEILGCGGTILKNISLKNKVHVLFGCGGNRDKSKRPKMAEIAGEEVRTT